MQRYFAKVNDPRNCCKVFSRLLPIVDYNYVTKKKANPQATQTPLARISQPIIHPNLANRPPQIPRPTTQIISPRIHLQHLQILIRQQSTHHPHRTTLDTLPRQSNHGPFMPMRIGQSLRNRAMGHS